VTTNTEIPTGSAGNPPNDTGSPETKAEIQALGLRYAEAADALGAGDAAQGRKLMRTCFTEEALVESFLVGHKLNEPAAYSWQGPDAFFDFLISFFASFGYISTHHQTSNFQITVRGDTATMKSYVTAIHVLGQGTSIDFFTATYTDEIARTPLGWRIARRTIKGTSYVRLSGTLPPLG
jgi:hypothetical protein